MRSGSTVGCVFQKPPEFTGASTKVSSNIKFVRIFNTRSHGLNGIGRRWDESQVTVSSSASFPGSSAGGNTNDDMSAASGSSMDAFDSLRDQNISSQDASPSVNAPAADGKALTWWQRQQQKSAALRKKLVALGPAAVLAYGLFDGITYTIAFSIAFLGYEAKTGLNPTANLADIVKIVLLMWAGNNATRPFRLAGAAALAPAMEKLMEWMKDRFRFPNKMVSFFVIVAFVAIVCFGIVGSLFLSRYLRG